MDEASSWCGKRVALGMSGGVDSSVAAIVLQRAGCDVVGVTCRFLDGQAADAAAADARAVCVALGIEHREADCRDAFEREVVSPFVAAYGAGLTPSPCVRCNARAKLPALDAVAREMGCDAVATGHYARVAKLRTGRFAVLSALDAAKDQSYMLALLGQEQLSRLVLPLGAVTKAEARIIAADAGLPVADKPDSQDICFAPDGYRALLSARGVQGAPGPIVDASGRELGTHAGLVGYTVGQRKGIGVAGPAPYYVIAKDAEANRLIVGTAEEALARSVVVGPPVWQALEGLVEDTRAMVKLRYRSRPVACIMKPMPDGRVLVELSERQPTTAPGQYAVFSVGGTVLGGGMIEEVRSA